MRFILPILFLVSLTACGSLPYKEFDEIQKGMDRSDVTERIGSPLHVKQNKQPHVWIYRFYDESKNELYREIQFENGKVIYAGPRVTKDKILFPTGSSYTQTDLEDFLKDSKNKENADTKSPEKSFQDQATMEEETLKELAPKGSFKEIKPTE